MSYKMNGFMIRNCKSFTNINVLETVQSTYIRSKLEYDSIVWSLFYNGHKLTIKTVQRKFLKFMAWHIDGIYLERGTPYHQLVPRSKIPTLNMK